MTNPFGGSFAPGAPFGSNQSSTNPTRLENSFEANKMTSGNLFGNTTAMSTGNTAFGATTFGNPNSSASAFGSSTFGSFGKQRVTSNPSGPNDDTTASTFGSSQFGKFVTQAQSQIGPSSGSNITTMVAPISLFGAPTFGGQAANVTQQPGEFSTGEFSKSSTGTVFGNKQAAPKTQSVFGGSTVFGNTPVISSQQKSSNLFRMPVPVTRTESAIPINTSSNARTSTSSVFGGFVGDKKTSLFGKAASQGGSSVFVKVEQDQESISRPMQKSNLAKESDLRVMDRVKPASNLFQKASTSTSLFGKKASTSYDIGKYSHSKMS